MKQLSSIFISLFIVLFSIPFSTQAQEMNEADTKHWIINFVEKYNSCYDYAGLTKNTIHTSIGFKGDVVTFNLIEYEDRKEIYNVEEKFSLGDILNMNISAATPGGNFRDCENVGFSCASHLKKCITVHQTTLVNNPVEKETRYSDFAAMDLDASLESLNKLKRAFEHLGKLKGFLLGKKFDEDEF